MSVPLGYPWIIASAWLYDKSPSALRVTSVGSLEAFDDLDRKVQINPVIC